MHHVRPLWSEKPEREEQAGNVYNIGSKDVVSVRYIADKISEAITGSAGLIQNVPDRLYNDCR